MKKVLFIDRDGTLIKEPEEDFQIDSLDKLEFLPGVFRNLYHIKNSFDYELVMITNQDGLGTASFPEDTFWPAHNKMLLAFKNEGIEFDDILIDKSLPEENAPTRKPGTAMLKKYIEGEYDLSGSYVIGDRMTDLELAKNLDSKGILLNSDLTTKEIKKYGLENTCILNVKGWDKVLEFLAGGERTAHIRRKTKETDIEIKIDLDGNGKMEIKTGIGFFDHMLEQIGKHSGSDLTIKVTGDLQVDEHHTMEDTALALGEGIKKALGDKRGIERYGFALPMDDSIAQVVLDFGGRPWLVWNADFKREKIGDMPTEMFMHFFKSLSDSAQCNINITARGDNEHHKIESIFKAFARALKMAKKRDIFNYDLPTTKGLL